MVKIIFKNFEVKADVNASCYITDEKFEVDDLSEVTIIGEDGNEQILRNVIISEAYSADGRYWFGMREMSPQELKEIKTQAYIEYIAMMADVELPEEV